MDQLGAFADKGGADGVEERTYHSASGSEKELARMYFRFLLEKIASRIHEQQLQQELVGIVERERRPLADYLQLQNEVAKAKQHPSDVGFMSLLLGSKNVQRADVCMFN